MNLNNFSMLQQMRTQIDQFKLNHPKFPLFLKAVSEEALVENTVIEMTVTTPEGKVFTTNLKVKPEDITLLESIKSMNSN